VVFPTRNPKPIQQDELSVKGAHNVWDVLTAAYSDIEGLQVWDSFVHDIDLKYILSRYQDHLWKWAKTLEGLCKQFAIKTGARPRQGVRIVANTEAIDDEQAAIWLLTASQEALEMLFSAFFTSVANDRLRAEFGKEVMWHVENLDDLIKYLRLKGWIARPPIYPSVPKEAPDSIDTAEAFNLWDHLTFVYDSIELIDLYTAIAHDADLKGVLGAFGKRLRGYTQTLESECLKYGIPLPKPPTKAPAKTRSKEWMEDEYILRHLVAQSESSSLIHTSAYGQSTTNAHVRSIFGGMLVDAMDSANKLMLYSKTKGWTNESPRYKPGRNP
jgi:hypothetical protein